MTIAQTLRPARAAARVAYEVMLVVFGSSLIALCAQINVDLPFSPVPVTGQTFAVLLVGLLMGRTRGAATVAAYIGEGLSGLPVFAGGAAGPAVLAGPTGGYLAGFVVAAWITGYLAERRWDRHVFSTMIAMVVGLSVIFVCGLVWLSFFVPRGHLLATGLVPFIIGDAVKVTAAAVLLPALRKFVR